MSSTIPPHSHMDQKCTERCKFTNHGDILTAAISKRGVSDADLCSYFNFTCNACESVRDSFGRTALHVAASCGRKTLVKWLIQNRHADINAKDEESGYTALHRSIFYGKINIAVELIKLGANTSIQDANCLTMLEHAMKDSYIPEESRSKCGEVYILGSNANNSLGPQQARLTPELFDVFHKGHPRERPVQICISKFHSVIVSDSGKVFSCGHGLGGRLGLGVQHTVVTPQIVNFPENYIENQGCIVQASISKDHSIFLDLEGNVFSCGLNLHHVLGLTPPPKQSLTPKQLKQFPNKIIGVASGQYHSIAWSENTLYSWGLNAGQLGHKICSDDKYVTSPKAVVMLNCTHIKAVSASGGATAVSTEKGDIYVLHEYQCRKIASRQLNVVQVSVTGGKLNSSLHEDLSGKAQAELKILAMTNTGNLLLWQESDQQLLRLYFSVNRAIYVKQTTINANGILFVSRDGEAFRGTIRPRKKKSPKVGDRSSAIHKFLDREDCIYVKISKFPRVHRAIYIQSDPEGKDCGIIQAHPYKMFKFPGHVEHRLGVDLKKLLDETNKFDDLHDVIFKVQNENFPAHRFILSSRSQYFENLLSENDKKNFDLGNDFHPDIFRQLLLYIYSGNCDLLNCGECPDRFKDFSCELDKKSSNKNPLRHLHEMSKKFGCIELQNALSNLDMVGNFIRNKKNKFTHTERVQFDRASFPYFYDVIIKCQDGKEIGAHKCVLAARLEYFNNMFSVRWHQTERSSVTFPFPKPIAESVLEYLYKDSLSHLDNKEIDHLCKILVLSDQFFAEKLKLQCENLLNGLLTLKNVIQLFCFSHIYNAINLKYCCMKFIISNLAPLIESRSLDDVEDCLLQELSDFYFNEKEEIQKRMITPYSTAPSDEEIISVATTYPVSLDEEVEKCTQKSQKKRFSKNHKVPKSPVIQEKIEKFVSDDENNIIQFPDSCDDNNLVTNRLRAIKTAKEIIKSENIQPEFTKLLRDDSGDNLNVSGFDDFPLLNSPPNSSFHPKSQKFENKLKSAKISQKQKKRLSSENQIENNSPTLAESPKNPWKILVNPSPSPESSSNINDIISNEKKQKENLVKIKTKLLIYTQIEDKAIDALRKFYNTDNVTDEIITVHRVDMGAIASPIWVLKARN